MYCSFSRRMPYLFRVLMFSLVALTALLHASPAQAAALTNVSCSALYGTTITNPDTVSYSFMSYWSTSGLSASWTLSIVMEYTLSDGTNTMITQQVATGTQSSCGNFSGSTNNLGWQQFVNNAPSNATGGVYHYAFTVSINSTPPVNGSAVSMNSGSIQL